MQHLSVFPAAFRRLLLAPGFSRWEKGNAFLGTKPASAGLLDSQGEWYLDVDGSRVSPASSTPRLFYKPKTDEMNANQDAIASNVEIYYPRSSVILLIKGTTPPTTTPPTPRAPVEHLSFQGFTMEHANWGLTTESDSYGFDGIVVPQSFATVGSQYDNGIFIYKGNNISIKENRIQHMGGNALLLMAGSNHCSVIGNAVTDIAYSGIASSGWCPDESYRNSSNRIENNYVTRVGQTVHCGVAIYTTNNSGSASEVTTIRQNEIKNVPYTGIDVGFFSPYNDQFVTVENNEISYAMNLYNDGAGIYTIRLIDFGAAIDQDNPNDPFANYSPAEYFAESNGYNTFLEGVKINSNHIHHITRINREGMPVDWPSTALYLDLCTAGTASNPLEIKSNYWHDIEGNTICGLPYYNIDYLEDGHPLDHNLLMCVAAGPPDNPNNRICYFAHIYSPRANDSLYPSRLPGVPAESLMNRHNIVQEKNAHVVNGVPHYEGNTTQELQSIVDNAGLTAEYEWIKNGLE